MTKFLGTIDGEANIKMTVDVSEHDITIRVTSDINGDLGSVTLCKDGLLIGDLFLPWDFKSNEDIPYDMSWLPKVT